MRRSIRFLAPFLIALAGGSGDARGATVSSDSATRQITILAAPGERNDISVDGRNQPLSIVVTDDSSALTAGVGCQAESTNAVTCPISSFLDIYRFDVSLGDLPDRFLPIKDARYHESLIDGGPGNDFLYGGEPSLYLGMQNDTLLGGAGNDRMFPANGSDTVLGGSGDDIYGLTDYRANIRQPAGDYLVHPDFDIEAGPAICGGTIAVHETVKLGPGDDSAQQLDGFDTHFTQEEGANDDTCASFRERSSFTFKGGAGKDRFELTGNAPFTVAGGSGRDQIDVRSGAQIEKRRVGPHPDGVDCGAANDNAYVDTDERKVRSCEVTLKSGNVRVSWELWQD